MYSIPMPMPSRLAVVLSHVAFEDLGSLEAPLRERGFAIETVDVATARFPLPQAESCDLLVVMGGPIGVYDRQEYPFWPAKLRALPRVWLHAGRSSASAWGRN